MGDSVIRLNPDRAMAALDFARERHLIWERRQYGIPGPWTQDLILATRKFTNMFRVLDPGSQFPLANLYQTAPNELEVLARAWLYRHTNLPAPWRVVHEAYGQWPILSTPDGSGDVYEVFTALRERGEQWSSGAYILRPESIGGKHVVGGDKVEFFTRRCRELFARDKYDTVTDFFATEDPAERHAILTRPEGVGGFMALQILTDFHYTLSEDRENEFVVFGPGSIKGAKDIAPGERPEDVFRWLRDTLADEGPDLLSVGSPRTMSLMDCQNLMCEWGKYCREEGKENRPSVPYKPAHPGPQNHPTLPAYYH